MLVAISQNMVRIDNCMKKKFSHTHQFHEKKKLSSTLFLGISNDRFCGGQLNSESNEEESIPIYSEVKSQIIWLQFVTGSRDPFVMAELEQRSTTRNRQNSGFFSGSGMEFFRQNRWPFRRSIFYSFQLITEIV